MSIRIKDVVHKKSPMTQGHRMCPGCGAPTAVHQGLMGVDFPLVVVNATGCLEVSTTVYPFSAWRVPWIHTAFENAGAGVSGVEAAYQALKKRGKIDKEIKFVAFGGDGGTKLAINYTVNLSGDPVKGTFNPTTKAFTADED